MRAAFAAALLVLLAYGLVVTTSPAQSMRSRRGTVCVAKPDGGRGYRCHRNR